MISITPHEMKLGKIISIKVIDESGKTETIEINPIDFSAIDSIKQTIINHVEAKGMLDEAYQEYMDVKKQFEAIESEYNTLTAPKIRERVIMKEPPKSEIPEPEPNPATPTISTRLEHIQKSIEHAKETLIPEPKEIIPESEATRLVNDLKIHMVIFEKSSAFNRNELQAEVAKHVPENMVDETTDKVLALLEQQGIVKSKAGIFKKLKQMVSKK